MRSGPTVNKIDRNYRPKRDHELVFGIDREIGQNFAVGAAYPWRRATNWTYRPRLGGTCSGEPTFDSCRVIMPEDCIQNAPATANGYTTFTYSPNPALVAAGGGGRLTTNAPGYHTTFNGAELSIIKRLSNRWMGRVAFSFNDWTEHWDGRPDGVGQSTLTSGLTSGQPTREERDPRSRAGRWPPSPAVRARRASTRASSGSSTPTPSCRCRGARSCQALSSGSRMAPTRSASIWTRARTVPCAPSPPLRRPLHVLGDVRRTVWAAPGLPGAALCAALVERAAGGVS